MLHALNRFNFQLAGRFVAARKCLIPTTHYLHYHTYTTLRHQANIHNRSPSPRSPTLHHTRCAPPPHSTSSFACSAPPACDLPALVPALSSSPKLKRPLWDLEIAGPPGENSPTGTRFHIPDFSLISGSPGDKASTRSRGPVTRVTVKVTKTPPRLVPTRAVACRA